MQRAGFRCVAAIDSNHEAIDVFGANFRSVAHALQKDLRKFGPAELEALIGSLTIDVIVGGPPCQGFSTARQVDWANHGSRVKRDKRRYLYREFLEYVRHFRPRVFVMENVPNLNLANDGVEFFIHSPFAERDGDKLLDRNENCLVSQAVIRSGGRDTKFLITADSIWEGWEKMVNITRAHGNDDRLAWDIFKIPHHCSYLSMAADKGSYKTEPTAEFEWLLNQGATRSVMVSSSREIPEETTDQPPHVETYRRYKETADAVDADLIVTMENPSKRQPKRTVITIGGDGPTAEKEAFGAGVAITTTRSPRVG